MRTRRGSDCGTAWYPKPVTVTAHTGSGHRERLVEAMADLLAERGYASVTVAEIVARARVSKRTFYEQFAEREDCFLATYVALAEEPLARIAAAATDPDAADGPLTDQVGRAVGAYLEAMAERPALTRALLTEIATVGSRGRAVRREVLHRFAAQLVALSEEARLLHAGVAPLSPTLALGLVGGINELVLDAVDAPEPAGGASATVGMDGLAHALTDLVVAVLQRSA